MIKSYSCRFELTIQNEHTSLVRILNDKITNNCADIKPQILKLKFKNILNRFREIQFDHFLSE
ncbi:hypothetical protein MACH09_30760 [Vibrio sp. MACH09]|nr:hypothetical protein MACH09_30760 [Vibrio sp. MACH09]